MSRFAVVIGHGLIALILLLSAGAVSAQAVVTMASNDGPPSASDIIANADRMVRGDRANCDRHDVSGDIIVCGSRRTDQALPAPEIYGPVRGATDGSAVDPRGLPCGAGPTGCYVGVNLPKLAGALVGVVGLILDPDRNLGDGTPIPARFRGSNR